MAVQRNVWRRRFVNWPSYPCPSCNVGTLKIDKKSVNKEETSASLSVRDHDAWEPDWINQRFVAMLICANPSCEDKVFVCGKIEVDWMYAYGPNGETVVDSDEYFIPHFFEPAPRIFPIPKECPGKVVQELDRSFALFWSDVGSAGNRLRVAIEILLKERKIPFKTKISKGSKKRKYRDLTLHERIQKFESENRDAALQLMAIKWLGNTASHAGLVSLTPESFLDALEHFEYAIDLIYVKRDIKLKKRARKINKKKGPLAVFSKRRRRLRDGKVNE